jgi:hypothetical protein
MYRAAISRTVNGNLSKEIGEDCPSPPSLPTDGFAVLPPGLQRVTLSSLVIYLKGKRMKGDVLGNSNLHRNPSCCTNGFVYRSQSCDFYAKAKEYLGTHDFYECHPRLSLHITPHVKQLQPRPLLELWVQQA